MTGRGPQMSKPDQNEPNNDPRLNSVEVKYPLFVAEFLPPNRHQTNWYISTKFYYQSKVGQSVFAHFWLCSRNSFSVEGSIGSLLFRAGRTRTLPPCLGWGRGRLQKTPRSGQQRLDTPDPIIPWTPAPESSSLDSAAAAPGPRHFSEANRFRRLNLNK